MADPITFGMALDPACCCGPGCVCEPCGVPMTDPPWDLTVTIQFGQKRATYPPGCEPVPGPLPEDPPACPEGCASCDPTGCEFVVDSSHATTCTLYLHNATQTVSPVPDEDSACWVWRFSFADAEPCTGRSFAFNVACFGSRPPASVPLIGPYGNPFLTFLCDDNNCGDGVASDVIENDDTCTGDHFEWVCDPETGFVSMAYYFSTVAGTGRIVFTRV